MEGSSFPSVRRPTTGIFMYYSFTIAMCYQTPIESSVAWGGIRNNPFGRNKLDQVGLGIFWDKTNLKAVAQPARNAERGAELYYNYALFKALWLTPDIQIYFDPALKPGAGPAAVFTIRTTALF